MITSWRITAAEYSESAFSGEGARLYGGRWNLQETPMVYTAQSASLAALELLVRLERKQEMWRYVVFACSFDEALAGAIDVADLPSDWRANPAPPILKELGETWVQSASSAVLRVPSVIIESEYNYLLNPRHAQFSKIEIADAVPFSLDVRLLRR